MYAQPAQRKRTFRSAPIDIIGKLRMLHRQTSYDSVVLTKNTGIIRGLPIEVTNETSYIYDSVVLTKDTGVIRGLPIDDDPRACMIP